MYCENKQQLYMDVNNLNELVWNDLKNDLNKLRIESIINRFDK